MNPKYSVSYKGQFIYLNEFMLDQQGLTDNQVVIDNLLINHYLRLVLVDRMKNTPIENIDRINELIDNIEEIDYALQELWGFEQNNNFHRFWELPHCTCPNNQDHLGYDIKTIDMRCPLHGVRK